MTEAPERAGFLEVAVPLPLPGALTYSIPADLDGLIRPGQRVRVPVGRRTLTGLALRRVESRTASRRATSAAWPISNRRSRPTCSNWPSS